jgi:hypothetical protein
MSAIDPDDHRPARRVLARFAGVALLLAALRAETA